MLPPRYEPVWDRFPYKTICTAFLEAVRSYAIGQSRYSRNQAGYVICFIICRRLCILFKDIICLQCVTTLIVHFSYTPRIDITDSLACRTSSSYAATQCLRSHATRLRKTLSVLVLGLQLGVFTGTILNIVVGLYYVCL